MAHAHDAWLTEWSRLHGYPIDASLVSSAHPLGYGNNYIIKDDNATCHRVAIARNGRHSMTSVHCDTSPDLKPTDNFWADIKRNLSRNTPRNVLEFEITIHDILNEIHTMSFLPTGPVNA